MKTVMKKNSMNRVTIHTERQNELYGEREYNEWDDTHARQPNAAMFVYCFVFQLCHNFNID